MLLREGQRGRGQPEYRVTERPRALFAVATGTKRLFLNSRRVSKAILAKVGWLAGGGISQTNSKPPIPNKRDTAWFSITFPYLVKGAPWICPLCRHLCFLLSHHPCRHPFPPSCRPQGVATVYSGIVLRAGIMHGLILLMLTEGSFWRSQMYRANMTGKPISYKIHMNMALLICNGAQLGPATKPFIYYQADS